MERPPLADLVPPQHLGEQRVALGDAHGVGQVEHEAGHEVVLVLDQHHHAAVVVGGPEGVGEENGAGAEHRGGLEVRTEPRAWSVKLRTGALLGGGEGGGVRDPGECFEGG